MDKRISTYSRDADRMLDAGMSVASGELTRSESFENKSYGYKVSNFGAFYLKLI